MAHYEKRLWAPDLTLDGGVGIPRRDRRGGMYAPYIPDPLVGRPIALGGAEAADAADAERAITALDRTSSPLADTEALARLLLRAESVASSHIEGLHIGVGRLLRADAARAQGEDPRDVTATEVLANIDAMAFAIDAVRAGAPITRELLPETHKRLLEPTRIAAHSGQVRTQQNWIGGSDYNPCSASFVPPPPELVDALLDDLCIFCNDDNLPAVVQAALAHAQFETIHPFADGNGRIGRVLIHLVLRRRGLTTIVSPPISLILATRTRDYITGLTATRYDGPPDSRDAQDGMNRWIAIFSGACTRAAVDASAFEDRISAIQVDWRSRLGPIRKDATALRIIDVLPGTPLVTVADLRKITGSAMSSITAALAQLERANIIVPVSVGRKRKRVFQAWEIVDAFTDLERQLASPAGDTHIEPPTRHVPQRPQARRSSEE